jgi:hypothetical protein
MAARPARPELGRGRLIDAQTGRRHYGRRRPSTARLPTHAAWQRWPGQGAWRPGSQWAREWQRDARPQHTSPDWATVSIGSDCDVAADHEARCAVQAVRAARGRQVLQVPPAPSGRFHARCCAAGVRPERFMATDCKARWRMQTLRAARCRSESTGAAGSQQPAATTSARACRRRQAQRPLQSR